MAGRVEQHEPRRIWLVIGTHGTRLDRSRPGMGRQADIAYACAACPIGQTALLRTEFVDQVL
jgi:hypothetical protein